MNIQIIQSNLINYHKKDRNYTIFAMLFYAIVIGSIVSLFIYSGVGLKVFSNVMGMESGANVPVFVKYIPYLMSGSIGFFLLYKLYTISTRETKINQFINKIKNQDTIIHFIERIDYKLYIPLRIVNLHLLPVQYAMVQFADKKTFHIPMPENCVQPIKSIASGSNTIGITDTWAELEK